MIGGSVMAFPFNLFCLASPLDGEIYLLHIRERKQSKSIFTFVLELTSSRKWFKL